jgi:hypothetical protein
MHNLLARLWRYLSLGVMGTFTAFDTTTLWEADGTDSLKAANAFQMVLIQSGASLTSSGFQVYGDLTNEVANGQGYTTGGIVLTGVTLTRSVGTTTFAFTGPSPGWTATGTGIPAWRWMVVYVNATLNGHVKPLIGFELGDATPADVPLTPSGSTITITGSLLTITHTP